MKNQTFCCIPNRNAVQNSTCLRCTAWFCCTTPYCNSLRACFFSFVPCYRRASQGSTVFYCSFSCRPAIRACVVRSLTTHGSWGRRRNSNMYFYAKKVFYDSGRVLWRAQLWGSLSCISQMVSVWIILRWSRREKYINIPSEKYIYVRIYVYICVFT